MKDAKNAKEDMSGAIAYLVCKEQDAKSHFFVPPV
jgi:hypothetical protein